MRKFNFTSVIVFSTLLLLVLTAPALALAEPASSGDMQGMEGMEGMDHEMVATEAAEAMPGMDHEGYKPPEQAADDSTMAAIVATIFSLPIGGWLVVRSVRKAKKNPK